eukprot:CAMPEP_0175922750 /NCGR_PEP_ID=MMETSP0108-20121206/14213_1 /TAXON_ID=195067 ORGANISM="Goniomonas pacifica, Strain CCMP1869" /NCGR_SAMPLE_ID=MMETSP0108 /ASSEMBLY_ACC=CAM_ASM_000204 /LENGTH=149 /DNA_ID=CAMNT_0017245723 /DNA_START=24 /DNA_END=473 /DNA_ORIENTATION=-
MMVASLRRAGYAKFQRFKLCWMHGQGTRVSPVCLAGATHWYLNKGQVNGSLWDSEVGHGGELVFMVGLSNSGLKGFEARGFGRSAYMRSRIIYSGRQCRRRDSLLQPAVAQHASQRRVDTSGDGPKDKAKNQCGHVAVGLAFELFICAS